MCKIISYSPDLQSDLNLKNELLELFFCLSFCNSSSFSCINLSFSLLSSSNLFIISFVFLLYSIAILSSLSFNFLFSSFSDFRFLEIFTLLFLSLINVSFSAWISFSLFIIIFFSSSILLLKLLLFFFRIWISLFFSLINFSDSSFSTFCSFNTFFNSKIFADKFLFIDFSVSSCSETFLIFSLFSKDILSKLFLSSWFIFFSEFSSEFNFAMLFFALFCSSFNSSIVFFNFEFNNSDFCKFLFNESFSFPKFSLSFINASFFNFSWFKLYVNEFIKFSLFFMFRDNRFILFSKDLNFSLIYKFISSLVPINISLLNSKNWKHVILSKLYLPKAAFVQKQDPKFIFRKILGCSGSELYSLDIFSQFWHLIIYKSNEGIAISIDLFISRFFNFFTLLFISFLFIEICPFLKGLFILLYSNKFISILWQCKFKSFISFVVCLNIFKLF